MGGGKGETGKEGKKEVRRERWKGGVIDTELQSGSSIT